jgi:hippurate hydrolase
MAAFDIFDLTLTGKGCHAAMPHLGKDALLAACQLVTQLPALIAREQEVHKPAVLSVTSFNAGDTYNVMPEVIKLRGTVRCFDMPQRARIEQRFRDAIAATCALHGLEAHLDYRVSYPATINNPSMPKSAPRC